MFFLCYDLNACELNYYYYMQKINKYMLTYKYIPWEYWQHSTISCVENTGVSLMLVITLILASCMAIEEKA